MGPFRYDSFVRTVQKILVMCVLLLGVNVKTESVTAHSGGTDKYGCHGGSQPYHCHNSGPSVNSGSNINSGQNKRFLQHLKLNGLNAKGKFRVVLKRHETCESLNNLYLRGVAVSKQVLSGGTSRTLTVVSQPLYEINRHLDANNNGIACGFLEPENFRIPTFLCGQVNWDAQRWSPDIGSDNSYSHCSSSDPAMGGWNIEVVLVTPDAETAILAENSEYRPVKEIGEKGDWYFLVKLRITNLTPVWAFFPEQKLGLLGPRGNEYKHPQHYCGQLHSWDETQSIGEAYYDKSVLEAFAPNESRLVNFCWNVMSSDVVAGIMLFFEIEGQWCSSWTCYKDRGASFIDMGYKKP